MHPCGGPRITDPTNPGDIVVIGQRRRPGGSFPPPSGGGGGPGEDGGIHQNEVGQEPEDTVSPPDPCTDPDTALEWNADAAAAEAAEAFTRKAAEQVPPEDLNTREWGAYLYRAGDGSIQVGPITSGPPFSLGGSGTVSLILGDFDPSAIVGSVHSHSAGNHLPSSGNDQAPGDIQHLTGLVAYSGNPSARLYIVTQNQGPAGFVPYNQINIYNQSTIQQARDSFTPGPEVNHDGTPCPGT